jgi:hypothetical protein
MVETKTEPYVHMYFRMMIQEWFLVLQLTESGSEYWLWTCTEKEGSDCSFDGRK